MANWKYTVTLLTAGNVLGTRAMASTCNALRVFVVRSEPQGWTKQYRV